MNKWLKRRLSRQDTMEESKGNDEAGRKRKRTTTGSQTDEDSSNNMAETLAEINCKLDLTLAQVQEIEEINKNSIS